MSRPVSLLDHVSPWMAGWPAVSPHPAADWELVFSGRTRCPGQNGSLERLPFLFQLCK